MKKRPRKKPPTPAAKTKARPDTGWWWIADLIGDILYYVFIRPVTWLFGKLAKIGDDLL